MRTLSGARSAAAPKAARHAKNSSEIRTVKKPAGMLSVSVSSVPKDCKRLGECKRVNPSSVALLEMTD